MEEKINIILKTVFDCTPLMEHTLSTRKSKKQA